MLNNKYLRILLLVGIAFSISCQPLFARENVSLTASKSVEWKEFLGVNAHFLWFTPEEYEQQMFMLEKLGLNWVRVDLHWDRHEKTRNVYNLGMVDELVTNIQAHNLRSLFYLVGSAPFASSAPAGVKNSDQYPPIHPKIFAERMGVLVSRYPMVDAWQIWNEQNTPAFWQPKEDPIAYGKLFEESVKEIRSIDPNKQIVMGGMAYYSQMPHRGGLMLEALQQLGAFSLGTAIAYHPYSLEPEGDEPEKADFVLRAKAVNEHLRKGGASQIWATEWGWSSYSGEVEEQALIGEAGQADYLLRRLALMSVLDYDRIFMFALSDLDSRATLRDQSYGLLDLNGNEKPVYTALSHFLDFTGPELSPAEPVEFLFDKKGLVSITWSQEDNKLWMFWAQENGLAKIRCTEPATLLNPLTGETASLDCTNGIVEVEVIKSLQLLKFN